MVVEFLKFLLEPITPFHLQSELALKGAALIFSGEETFGEDTVVTFLFVDLGLDPPLDTDGDSIGDPNDPPESKYDEEGGDFSCRTTKGHLQGKGDEDDGGIHSVDPVTKVAWTKGIHVKDEFEDEDTQDTEGEVGEDLQGQGMMEVIVKVIEGDGQFSDDDHQIQQDQEEDEEMGLPGVEEAP